MLASAGVAPSDPGAESRAASFRASQVRELVDLLLLDLRQREAPRRLPVPVDAEVQRRWQRAQEARGRQKLAELLRAWGVSEQDVREELRLEVLREAYLQALAAEEPVAEEFVRREYEQNRHLYRIPDRYRLKGLLTKTREEAERARAELLAGREFADVARRYSADPRTRSNGGEVGWLDDSRMHPWLLQAVRRLRRGELSPVVAGPTGWYVVRLEDFRAGRQLSYAEARPLIVRQFKLSAARTTLGALMSQLRRDRQVRVYWPTPELPPTPRP
jgi:parvulin-like peptidyl-prolyl isomerase